MQAAFAKDIYASYLDSVMIVVRPLHIDKES